MFIEDKPVGNLRQMYPSYINDILAGQILLRVLGKSNCPPRYEKQLNKTTLKKWTKNAWKLFPEECSDTKLEEGIKQKVEHGISCYIEDSKKAVDLHRSKPLISLTPFAPPLFSGIRASLCDNPYCFPS